MYKSIGGRNHPNKPIHQQFTHEQAIYDQGYIIADKHGGNKF